MNDCGNSRPLGTGSTVVHPALSPGLCLRQDRRMDGWTLDVTNADIRAARRAWLDAKANDAPAARVQVLYESYASMVHGQAVQIAEQFRSAHARRTRP